MAVKRRIGMTNYGFPDGAAVGAPRPIVTNRAPSTADSAEVGTVWVDTVGAAGYLNVGVIAGESQWAVNPLGSAAAAAFTVNPGNLEVTNGTLVVGGASTLTGAVALADSATIGTSLTVGTDLSVGGNSIFTGDVTINGSAVYNGDFDITSTDSISFSTSANAANAYLVNTTGGIAATVHIQNATGTDAASININSTAGGITLTSALNTTVAATTSVAASAGTTLDLDAVGALSINSSAAAINVGNDVVNQAVNIATAGVRPLIVGSTTGASASTLQSGSGAMTLTAGGILDMNVTDAVTVDTAASISLDSATASNFTVTGAADLTLSSTAGSVIVKGEEAVNDAIQLTSVAGGLTVNVGLDAVVDATGAVTIDAAGVLELNSSAGVISIGNDAIAQNINIGTAGVRDITIGNLGGATGLDLLAGTGDLTLTTAGTGNITADASSLSLDAALASNLTVTGAGEDLTLSSVGGSVVISGSEAIATAVHIDASDVAGGVTLETGTAGMLVTAPFIELNGLKIYNGAGAPAAALCTAVGDLYVRTDPGNANERLYIGTVVGTTWVPIAASA